MASFLVNGWPAQSIDTADRGLQYGDGVFRTLRVSGGRPLNWRRHYARLSSDCAALGLDCPDETLLLAEIARVAPGDATAKVIVTRGGSGRGYAYPEDIRPNRIVVAYPALAADPLPAQEGVRARRCDLVLARQPRLAGVKSLNRLENVLARAEWRDPAIREGFLVDEAGLLVEGTFSNVFVVKDGSLATPDLSRCGVAGAERERVIELAASEGIACAVRDIPFAECAAADEMLITNSVIGILPVIALGDWHRPPGPVTRRLQALVAADDASAP